jgi:Stigma-specific protein, Stig1
MAKQSLSLSSLIAILMFASLVTANPLTDKDKEKSVPQTDTLQTSATSMRGFNYLLRGTATCDKYPGVCQTKGSPGPSCCRKKCVNLMTDNLNCGICGRRCWYGQTCCSGNCIDVMYDGWNCGACNNRCQWGSYCNFGMCSYA